MTAALWFSLPFFCSAALMGIISFGLLVKRQEGLPLALAITLAFALIGIKLAGWW